MSNVIKHFFKPAIQQKNVIINSFDINILIRRNSVPIHILKIYEDFFSNNLCKIAHLSLQTHIFPDI